jgi:hypothetical protein
MPAISIDTFFACSLIVAVVVASMAMTTKILTPYMNSLQDLNEEEYLRKIVEYVIVNSGNPANWGEDQTVTPEAFGLAKNGSLTPYELDVDKISRLNSQNAYALTYLDILEALKLEKVALRIAVSQLMNVSIALTSNETIGDSTRYSFEVHVSRDETPIAVTLHCYVIARNFLNDTYSSTSSNGEGAVDVEIPNSSNGTALLVVFARAPYDARITAYGVYAFGHLSSDPSPKNIFLELSPLDYTLHVNPKYSNVSSETGYALSYSYESNLTPTSNVTYAIPGFLDSSPTVLVVTGINASTFFIEWTAYPQVPLEVGANFENAEHLSFSYIVTINRAFYKLNVQCGGPSQ